MNSGMRIIAYKRYSIKEAWYMPTKEMGLTKYTCLHD